MSHHTLKVVTIGCLMTLCALHVALAAKPAARKAVRKAPELTATNFRMPECFYWDKNVATEDANGEFIPQLPQMTESSVKVRNEIATTTRPILMIWSRKPSGEFPALRDPRVQQLIEREFYVVRTAGIGGHFYVTNSQVSNSFYEETMYAVGDREFSFYREWSGRLSADTLITELKEVADHVMARGYYAEGSNHDGPEVTSFFEDALEMAKKKNCAIVLSLYAYRCLPSNTFDRNIINSARVLQYLSNKAVLCRMDADHEGERFMTRAKLDGFPAVIILSPKGRISTIYDGGNTATEFVNYIKKAIPSAIKGATGTDMSDLPCRWMPGWQRDFSKAVANARNSNRKIFVFVDDHSFIAYRTKTGEYGFDSPAIAKILEGYERVQIEPSADNPLKKAYSLGSAPMAAILDADMNIYMYDDYLDSSYLSALDYADKIDTSTQDAELLRRLLLNPTSYEPVGRSDPEIEALNKADANWITRLAYEQLIIHGLRRFKTEQAYQLIPTYLEYMKASGNHPDRAYEYATQACRQFTLKSQHERAIAAGELAVSLFDTQNDARSKLPSYYYLGKAYLFANKRLDRARELLSMAEKIARQQFSNNLYRLEASAKALLTELDKKEGKATAAPK